jgi:hypothetical protein
VLISGDAKLLELNTAGMKPGIYFISVYGEGVNETKKFIKR